MILIGNYFLYQKKIKNSRRPISRKPNSQFKKQEGVHND
uniref:Uncharacterized protein n=1 Tax=Rhizophora mucronata TaxID=61149 RepID=A0A2P2N287_RHIMU